MLMKDTSPTLLSEVERVVAVFSESDKQFARRDRAFFLLGISCDVTITQLLTLKVEDVWKSWKPVDELYFHAKGQEQVQRVPLSTDGISAIEDIIAWHRSYFGRLYSKRPLFPSRNTKKGAVPMGRRNARNILTDAFQKAGFTGNLTDKQTGNMYTVREMLGHASGKEVSEQLSPHAYQNREKKVTRPDVTARYAPTIQARVLDVLSDGTEKATGEIINALADANPTNVKKAIRKAVEAGKIVKVRHGVYRQDT